MKLNGLLTALGVLVVLGGLVWWSNKHPATDTKTTPALAKLITAKPDEYQHITIAKTGSDPVELAKLAGNWEIVKPVALHADQGAVGSLAGTTTTITPDRLIDDHPANLEQFGLDKPTFQIDVTTTDGKTTKVVLGADNPSGTGTYAKLENDPKVYTVPVYLKVDLNKTVNDLRDKRLIAFNRDKLTSIKLDSATKNSSVEFGKNAQGDWQIVKPKQLRADGTQVDDLVRKLDDARMDLTSADSDPKSAAEQFASGTRAGTVSTTDNSGTQTLELRKGKNNSYYAKGSSVEGTYKLAGELGDSMDKTAEDFRNKKVFDFGFNDPTKIEINGTAYQRAGDRWATSSGQFDSGSLQSVIDKLRDLSATKFADKMGGTQTLVLGVTSGDNHRYEKITINKDGDSFDAQRDGEPAVVYVIDAKSMDDVQKAISAIKPYQAPKNEKKK
jgi:hypothetical protein